MELYIYNGAVTSFGKVITRNWSAQTRAPSEKKAINNLKYQYRQKFKLTNNAQIELPGEVIGG